MVVFVQSRKRWTYSSAYLLVEEYPSKKVDFKEFASKLTEDEINLRVMPIFWVAGHDNAVLSSTISDSTVALLSRWDVIAAMEAVSRYKVTSMYLTFDMYWQILEHPERELEIFEDLYTFKLCEKGLTVQLREKWKEVAGAILREARTS